VDEARESFAKKRRVSRICRPRELAEMPRRKRLWWDRRRRGPPVDPGDGLLNEVFLVSHNQTSIIANRMKGKKIAEAAKRAARVSK